MFGIIYKATNNITDKVYIGQTMYPLQHRIDRHLRENRTHFSRSLRKYSINVFCWDILEICDNKEELDEMEYHYIVQYRSNERKYGYNKTLGGGGSYGFHHTEETKQKIGNIHRGRKDSDETKTKKSKASLGSNNGFFGKTHTDEVKKYLSDINLDKTLTEETKTKIGDTQRGIKKGPFTEEHKRNISLSKTGKKRNEEHCAKQSQRMKADKNPNAKEYTVTYPNNKEVIIKSLKTFAETNNLPYNILIRLSNGHKTRKECLLGYKVIRTIIE